MVPTTLTLAIESMAHGGEGVARHEGKVYFIADTIPGEHVVAEISEEKKSYGRGVAVEILEPSPHRQDHIWDLASINRSPNQRIGGADYGHITYAHQLELKAQVIRDALLRFGKTEASVNVTPVEPNLAYRTRVSLHVDADGRLGQRAARSHTIIPIDEHPLATKALQELAPWRETYPGAERVDLVATSTGDTRILVREPNSTPDRSSLTVTEVVNGHELQVAESGFWQVHSAAPETLTAAVDRAVDRTRLDPTLEHSDLYGGVGLLALPLLTAIGPTAKLVTVESNERATDLAAANLSEWVGSCALTAKVENFVRHLGITKGSTVVLDPTRQGAGQDTMKQLLDSEPAQVIYVACDPVAFARDLAVANANGWKLDHLEAFDIFPQTHHVELVARLTP